MRLVFDIESNNLLTFESVDYTASPYKLRPFYTFWCAVAIDIDTEEVYEFVGQQEIQEKFIPMLRDKVTTLIGHNIIDFDMLALKMGFSDFDYEIGETCYINEREVEIIDTLVLSKVLNPDRYGGHSLDEWGKRLGLAKIDWRARAIELGLIAANAPHGAEFQQFHPEMVKYNRRDVEVNVKLYFALLEEMGDWPWMGPYRLELQVRDIITRQSHRGFKFNLDLALANVRDLDEKMEEIRKIVEPLLPPKLMGATKLKAYLPPKVQFKKNGEPSANLIKFIEKHEGVLRETENGWVADIYGKTWDIPMSQDVPVKTHEPATVKDTTHIKGWLVEMGWKPSQYKERDLTCDSKKHKLSQEKFEETVVRYVEQTLKSPFCKDRCAELGIHHTKLLDKLLAHDIKRPLKVYTNPTITVGMDKEIDPNLFKLSDEFPHAKLVSQYLTYAHRRNSILGGGFDPDDIDDDDEFAGKGYMASGRIQEDGRIPTPADSCGAGTSRMKHKLVANIPRITSLYGDRMRGMFGVDVEEGFIQMGYDFASLEAMIESHYCWRYDEEDHAYCNSLTMEKPNDVHTKTAALVSKMVSEAIGREFPFSRTQAKPVKYACVPMHTQALTRNGWKHYHELKIGDEVLGYNAKTGCKEWTFIRALVHQEDEVIEFGHKWFRVQATKDHRWFVKQRREFKTGQTCKSIRKAVNEVRTTEELNSESNIIVNAPMSVYEDTGSSGRLEIAKSKRNFDWVKHVLGMSQAERIAFLEGFMIADGYYDGRWQWSQNRGELAEGALMASYLVHGGIVQVRDVSNSPSPMMNVILGKTSHRTMQTCKKVSLGVQPVWCMTTDLGSWVMRQGDTITITGNCAYGAQPARVAKTVGCSVEIGALIHGAYWEAAKPLALLGEKLKKYWQTTGGKKFILGLDGRKIPTRSASALINSLFQSAGVICAKRAMVLHEKKLKEAGLYVDFFRDDWKNKKFVQQLIAYHDEAQCEMHKSLVKWKVYKVKEWTKKDEKGKEVDSDEVVAYKKEIAAFKAENPHWSEIGHTDKALYIGYCEAGRLIQEAVAETSAYYKLNVNLSADYILGRTWAECH